MNTKDIHSTQQAEWREREEHAKVMQALNKVSGCTDSYFYISGHYYFWKINELPAGEPERIAKRGNHEEILFMIHQYGKTKCYDDHYLRDYAWSSRGNESGAHLSDEVQRIILERNNPEEIMAYTSYHGFAPAGQDFIIERGNHTEIMTYLERHGFAPEQQLKLWARGNKEEIARHIKNHGCSDEILSALFDKLQKGEADGRAEFLEHISLHEFPVPFQIRMLKTVDHELFMAYIKRYGLWFEAHVDFVRERSVDEIAAYISKHRRLSDEGEQQLAYRHVTRLSKLYLEQRVNKDSEYIFDCLLRAAPLDKEALGTFFLNHEYREYYSEKEDCDVMTTGTKEDVLARIEKKCIGLKAVAALFFREGFEDCFCAYVKQGR